MGKKFCAAVILSLLLPLAAPAKPAESVSQTDREAFQLGLSLQLPTARAHQFIVAVKSLADLQSEAAAKKRLADLDTMAAALRQSEANSYDHTAKLLAAMSAPPMVQGWAKKSEAMLESPLAMSPEAKPFVKSDPQTARILATMDEALAIQQKRDSISQNLGIWLKLTQGSGGVWSEELGQFAAEMHLALISRDQHYAPGAIAERLLANMPQETPAAIRGALESLVPHPAATAPAGKSGVVTFDPGEASPATRIKSLELFVQTYDAETMLSAETGRSTAFSAPAS